MKKISSTILLLSFFSVFQAQIQVPGEPFQWFNKSVDLSEVNFVTQPKLDLQSLRAEDEVVDQYKETPYRFGYDWEVDYNVLEEDNLTILKNGDKLWRLGIHCVDATSINMIFGDYYIPEGGEVYIWNEARTEFLGALTHYNNKDYGSLAVGLVHSDKIVVEYRQPEAVTEQALLRITQISHGYRPAVNKWVTDKGPYGNSGACNMNVNCPDGADWQDEKRGVALILNGGSAWCTGSLINTTAEDGTPYFLTASHCNGNEANWVFVFNHEYTGCSNSGPAPTNQTISGAVEQTTISSSDAHLILLSSDVPEAYEPYYNGWDHSGNSVSSAVGIHHPSGDVKKISFDDDPLTKTQYGQTTPGDYNHWRIEAWERGTTTEPGSSGSPLFDQNHRIIGQLHGGAAACGNSVNDYYGAFHSSWVVLGNYLDPTNAGVSFIDGYDPYAINYTVDAKANGIDNIPSAGCSPEAFIPNFIFRNNGTTTISSAVISYSYNGVSQVDIPWSGTLVSGASANVTMLEFLPEPANNTIEVEVTISGDENSSNNTSTVSFVGASAQNSGQEEINIHIVPDNYGSELTWELKNPNGVVIESGGPYTNNDTTPIDVTYAVPNGNEGCYEFIIYDSYGDGLCCSYGIGEYLVTDVNGAILASGGTYLSQENTLFSILPGEVEVELKAFLQGPYNEETSMMNDNLRVGNYIPTQEPFTTLGFTHVGGGGEATTSSVFNTTGANAIVDWIFVELRDGNNSSQIVATQSALLQRDGDIVGMDGVSPLVFEGLNVSSVYVVLRHRNHLGIRTASAFSTSSIISVDFTNSTTMLFGNLPSVSIGGIEAMYSGDANNDGQINTVDKNDYWRVENGQVFDYFMSKADFNLDGVVNPVDKNSLWQWNNSRIEQLD